MIVMLAGAFVSHSFADSKSAMTIAHKELTSADLPDPEVPMVIRFSLSNTRELERTVRALIVKDGRLIEIPLLKSYLNQRDWPTYEFQLNAPLVELNYQFVAYDGRGGAIVSNRYSVRRACLPALQLTDISNDPTKNPDEQLKILFDRSVRLSEEIEQYEQSLKTLDSLQKLLKE